MSTDFFFLAASHLDVVTGARALFESVCQICSLGAAGSAPDGERGRNLLPRECSPTKLTTADTMDTLPMRADIATVRRRPESGAVEADLHCLEVS